MHIKNDREHVLVHHFQLGISHYLLSFEDPVWNGNIIDESVYLDHRLALQWDELDIVDDLLFSSWRFNFIAQPQPDPRIMFDFFYAFGLLDFVVSEYKAEQELGVTLYCCLKMLKQHRLHVLFELIKKS